MSTPAREGETIEGSRTTRNRPYPVLKCSSVYPDSCASRFFVFRFFVLVSLYPDPLCPTGTQTQSSLHTWLDHKAYLSQTAASGRKPSARLSCHGLYSSAKPSRPCSIGSAADARRGISSLSMDCSRAGMLSCGVLDREPSSSSLVARRRGKSKSAALREFRAWRKVGFGRFPSEVAQGEGAGAAAHKQA